MSHLTLTFLGQFQITLTGQPAIRFETDKVRALLAYLTVEGQKAHSRSTLSALLWPEYNEENARTNLRHALHQLRQAIGDAEATPPWLIITRQTLQFNQATSYILDVQEFTTLLNQCASHPHPQIDQCPSCLPKLRQAADLYRGDFLVGFAIDDSAAFEEWRRIKQEQLHQQAIETLQHLMRYSEAVGDDDLARQYALRQLALEPWREEAHRQIMRSLARSGQRSAALAHYQHCCRILTHELDTEPDVATTVLFEQIRSGAFPGKARGRQETSTTSNREAANHPTSHVQQAPARTYQDWGEMPGVEIFHGRAAELAQLEQWLTPARDALPARLVAVLGMGGAGKTTLTAKAVKACAQHFAVIIWRSLLNAPQLDEILLDWLQILSQQALSQLPESLDARLRLLFDYLRRHRCLFVLDNLESIFQQAPQDLTTGGSAGQPRADYADYTQLIQRMATTEHQSCLVLTSREQIQGLERLLGTTPPVQILSLSGLDSTAGQAILAAHGLTTAKQNAAGLVEQYSGNPLALQLVAHTIVDFFNGDIAAFQREEPGLFDDVGRVLDEQFARMTPLEREILIWLAIEREAVTVQTLRKVLVQSPSTRDILEALRSLQRRSLLEKADEGFTLQNVVIEYTTDYLIERIYAELTTDYDNLYVGNEALILSYLNRHVLVKAQAKEYVRHSQIRLIAQPIANRLLAKLGKKGLEARCQQILARLRAEGPLAPGYAGSNLLNLLLCLGIAPHAYDFSHLNVWQSDLRGVNLAGVNFAYANLTHTVFTDTFDFIYTVAFNPDGQQIAAGTGSGEIRLWRVQDGQPTGILKGHTGSVWSIAFQPDGATLISGSDDQTIRQWDLQSEQPLRTLLQGYTNGVVNPVAISTDGTLLATRTSNHVVCVWQTTSGALLHTLRGHTELIRGLAFSPDNALLASSSHDQTIRLWDMHSGDLYHSLHGHTDVVRTVAFSPDGATLASGSYDQTIRLWNVQQGQTIRVLQGHSGLIWSLAFSPDGALLASGSADQTIRLWSMRTEQAQQILQGHTGWVRALAFSPDSCRLLSGGDDQTVRLWDVTAKGRSHSGTPQSAGQIYYTLRGYRDWVWAVAFSPNGATLASGGNDQSVHLWDLSNPLAPGQVYQTLRGHTGWISSVAYSTDGKLLASGSADRTVRVWDVAPNPETPGALSPAAAKARHILRGHTHWIWCVAFSPDGHTLASASSDQSVRLWDLQTGKLKKTLRGHGTHVVRSVVFSPNGDLLASGGDDYTICLWQVSTGEIVHRLHGHRNPVRAVAFSFDGATLVSGSEDQTICVWDVQRGQVQQTLLSKARVIKSVAFSPSSPAGQVLASSGDDHIVRIWDLATGQCRYELQGHRQEVRSIAYSPTGDYLASGSADETIRLWDVHTGSCVNILRVPGPYAGMNITGVTGITDAQKVALKALGAIEADKESTKFGF